MVFKCAIRILLLSFVTLGFLPSVQGQLNEIVGDVIPYGDLFGVPPQVWRPLGPNNDESLSLFVEARSESAEPFLNLDPAASPVSAFEMENLQTGFENFIAKATKTHSPSPVDFSLAEGLSQTLYLNLAKPINGTLWWKSQATEATNIAFDPISREPGRDALRIRVELYVGSQFAGGSEFTYNLGLDAGKNWIPFFFHFRAEIHSVESGQPVTLRVTRIGGFDNFVIGTEAPVQSFIELFYYPTNPLAGPLYIENGQVFQSISSNQSASQASQCLPCPSENAPAVSLHSQNPMMGWFALMIPIVPVWGITALRSLRPRWALGFLFGLVILLPLFGGCLSTDPLTLEADETLDPSLKGLHFQYDENASVPRHLGFIEGLVAHEKTQLPIADAHVSIPGTNRFAPTDAQGRFQFEDVTPGPYTIRVDAFIEGQPVSKEELVNVAAGKILQLQILLGIQDAGIHPHDEWGGQPKLLFQDPFQFTPYQESPATKTTGKWSCVSTGGYLNYPCQSGIPIQYDRRILPGTILVEVILEWSPGPLLPEELGLRVLTATNRSDDQYFLPREPGKPFRIAIFPQEADPAHQPHTQWLFNLVFPNGKLTHPVDSFAYVGDANEDRVKATIWMHKGVVPFEPAHRDFWKGSGKLVLFDEAPLFGSCLYSCAYPSTAPGGYNWRLPDGVWVPPETQEIRGELRWKTALDTSLPIDWVLMHMPANSRSFIVGPRAEGNEAQTYPFRIQPTSEETDQYYQRTSNWVFSIAREGQTQAEPLISPGFRTEWFLSAIAIRDPSQSLG